MATKEAAGDKSRYTYKWTLREQLIVAVGARQVLAAGGSRVQALTEGQKALPRARRWPKEVIHRRAYPSNPLLDHAVARVATLSPEQVEELVPGAGAAVVCPQPYVPRRATKMLPAEYSSKDHPVTWNPIEWALLARRMDWWTAQGSDAGPARLMAEAQEIELPPERRRSRASLMVNVDKYAMPRLEQGRKEAHLIEGIPFDPMQRHWREAAPQPQESPQEPPPAAAAPTPQANPPQPVVEASRPPPEPVAAATPATTAAHEAARVFGINLANALVPMVETMLTAHEQVVLARVREEQRAHADALAQSMTRLLLEGMDRMLGGTPAPAPAAEPTPPQPAEPAAPIEVETPRRPLLKVDVVGFKEGQHRLLVKHKLNGHLDEVDLRFVDPDEGQNYAPHKGRHILMLTHRVPHSIKHKLQASGCKPTYIKHTVGHVVTAIETLLRQQQG